MRTGTLKIKWTEPIFKNSRKSSCAVLIPVYKDLSKLSKFEEKSIANTVALLGEKYDVFLLCGKSFDDKNYSEKFGYDFSLCKCTDDYFKSQKSYSDLCVQYRFYESFSDFEYILICQPDAWLFEDRLDYFISLGYDYIGCIHMLRANGSGGRVGNGGLSLRKVKRFVEVCKETDFEQYRFTLFEDCIFSIRLKSKFNIAPTEVGFDFGWQEHPSVAKEKTGKLPMGCHNPIKNNWNFWRNYIKLSDEDFDMERMKSLSGAEEISIRPSYTSNVMKKPRKLAIIRPI